MITKDFLFSTCWPKLNKTVQITSKTMEALSRVIRVSVTKKICLCSWSKIKLEQAHIVPGTVSNAVNRVQFQLTSAQSDNICYSCCTHFFLFLWKVITNLLQQVEYTFVAQLGLNSNWMTKFERNVFFYNLFLFYPMRVTNYQYVWVKY